MRIRSGTAVLIVMANLLLIPLLAAGLVHLSARLLPHSMLLAAGFLLLTSLAWMFRPAAGAVLQIVAGAVVASIILVQPHYAFPRTAFRIAFELLVILPLAASILAAVVGARRHIGR
jgi:hypothetical protein